MTESTASGFFSRSIALPSTTPLLRSNLQLVYICCSMLYPRDFLLALFDPDIAVTSSGDIRKLEKRDYDAILSLASRTESLPKAPYHTWRIYHPYTCLPSSHVYIPFGKLGDVPTENYKEEFREVGVHGYRLSCFPKRENMMKLEETVGGYTELPELLDTLFGVLHEVIHEEERDKEVVDRIRVMLGDMVPPPYVPPEPYKIYTISTLAPDVISVRDPRELDELLS